MRYNNKNCLIQCKQNPMKRKREEEDRKIVHFRIKKMRIIDTITTAIMNSTTTTTTVINEHSFFLRVIREEPALLYRLCYELRFSMEDLKNMYVVLRELARELPWLRRTIEKQQFHDLWFIIFKDLYPKEVIYAYEYDYIIKHPTTLPMAKTDHFSVSYQIESIISDYAINLCFYNGRHGVLEKAVSGIDGKLFYQTCNAVLPITCMMDREDEQTGFISLFNKKPEDIKVYHIKARRIMLLYIKTMAQIATEFCLKKWGSTACFNSAKKRWIPDDGIPECMVLIGSCTNYARNIKKNWNNHKIYQSEDFVELFCNSMDNAFSHSVYEDNLMTFPLLSAEYRYNIIKEIINQVDSEIPYKNENAFIDSFYDPVESFSIIQDKEKYKFIYESSPNSGFNFRNRLFYRNYGNEHRAIIL